jgi:hypothetical protein
MTANSGNNSQNDTITTKTRVSLNRRCKITANSKITNPGMTTTIIEITIIKIIIAIINGKTKIMIRGSELIRVNSNFLS